jgi:hypothetical protein
LNACPNPATWSTSGSASASSEPYRHAAGDDQATVSSSRFVERKDGVDRLLAGLADERTGVDDHEISGGSIVGCFHAVGDERADELVRVDVVLGTAERFDVEALHTSTLSLPHLTKP